MGFELPPVERLRDSGERELALARLAQAVCLGTIGTHEANSALRVLKEMRENADVAGDVRLLKRCLALLREVVRRKARMEAAEVLQLFRRALMDAGADDMGLADAAPPEEAADAARQDGSPEAPSAVPEGAGDGAPNQAG